ncbi:putative phosphatidylinositol-glycan biosynthesis class F protein-like isoform 2 [Capsicum annuum]|nr:putative phosphatidylinositol-glycan biosynthesis class F protein-like isoform 2 [Capsicum annuum]
MSKKKTDPKGGNTEALLFISSLKALTLHLICGLGLISAFWVGNHIYSLHLITHPSQTLRLISVFLTPVLILLYSYLRHDRNQCSYVKAVGRAACVFGPSWSDWHRIFARTKENESTDYMISLPAHGAVIGAWFGAWPMPLDWESPWQEWPICVTYGTIAGYLVGLVASSGCIFFRNHQQHLKEE